MCEQENPYVGLMWNVALKDGKVVPTGVVVYLKKQVIVPKDGEARLS